MKKTLLLTTLFSFILLNGFSQATQKSEKISKEDSLLNIKIGEYVTVPLTTNLKELSDREKQMIPYLIEASRVIDELYWSQSVDNKELFYTKIKSQQERRFADINYGPWDRLNGNKPFIPGFDKRPAGLYFYPADMTRKEFEEWNDPNKNNQYSVIRRDEAGALKVVRYNEMFREQLAIASQFLNKAADLAEEPGLKTYLGLRAQSLMTDDYFESDMAWMDMKRNTIDVVIGPIENYDDDLFGIRTSFEAFVLVKDREWSSRLARFATFLPELQKQLPVEEKYKQETPGTDSDLNAYDVIYAAGQANAGSKTIAINLPNDEAVQLKKGSRRLQLKNVMKAKFDSILTPISNAMIDKSQRDKVVFDAFFSNVMFHEVAHGLGIKNTITGVGTVREALKEKYAAFEEAKADVLGLYMVTKLIQKGEIRDLTEEQCFITYMAGLIRSVRFGASSSHGKANMMCFNYFASNNAFERTKEGYYKVNMDGFRTAMNNWAATVLMFEGNGNYQAASDYLGKFGQIRPELSEDLQRLKKARIPVDIVYEQGLKVIGLTESGQEIKATETGQKDKPTGKPQKPEPQKKPAPSPVK